MNNVSIRLTDLDQSQKKNSTRKVHIEGNDQVTRAAGVSEDGDKNHYVEQTFSHQRSRSSTWTPKLQGSAECKYHHVQPVSIGETDIQHVKIDSHEEHHDFERQFVQQTRAPAYLKTACDQQEDVFSTTNSNNSRFYVITANSIQVKSLKLYGS